jgi:hypothetical protein
MAPTTLGAIRWTISIGQFQMNNSYNDYINYYYTHYNLILRKRATATRPAGSLTAKQ